jgi:hypothetical protein
VVAVSLEFAIHQYSEQYNWGWYVKRMVMDETPTDRFQVLEATPAEFKLRSRTGEVITFTRTEDRVLENAP